jgi:hypothetical protein
MRVCSTPGCPAILPTAGKCPEHAREAEARRGSRQARGYDSNHDRLRKTWAATVRTGTVICWRCGEPISRTEPWDLGHDDTDRTTYRGPEHANRCNRAAAGRKSHT